MKPETVCTVVFSPTGTSKKIAETVARSIASDAGTEAAALKTIDLTHAAAHSAALSAGAVAVIAAPVYGGHVAPTAAKRLETLRGSGTPAVVIAVYGNRAFEKCCDTNIETYYANCAFRVFNCTSVLHRYCGSKTISALNRYYLAGNSCRRCGENRAIIKRHLRAVTQNEIIHLTRDKLSRTF